MKVKIITVYDRGDIQKERIHLRVLANTNLSYYIVFDTTYTGSNQISNQQRNAFWFPPKDVAIGDNVILYTRTGNPSEEIKEGGVRYHFLFRGLDRTVWNREVDCAVLFEVNWWETTPLPRPIFG